MHNSSSRFPVLADIQAIRPIHCLGLMKQPYNSAHINLGKRSHCHDTNIILIVKNSVKLDENSCIFKKQEYLK